MKGLAACTLASGLFLLIAGDVNHFMPIGESKTLLLELILGITRGVRADSFDRWSVAEREAGVSVGVEG